MIQIRKTSKTPSETDLYRNAALSSRFSFAILNIKQAVLHTFKSKRAIDLIAKRKSCKDCDMRRGE